ERRDAVMAAGAIDSGEDQEEVCLVYEADPSLLAVQDVAVAAAACAGEQRADSGPHALHSQGEAGDSHATREPRQPVRALLLRTPLEDRQADQGEVDGHGDLVRGVDPSEFLAEDGEGAVVVPKAAVARWEAPSENALGRHGGDRLRVRPALAELFLDGGGEYPLPEGSDTRRQFPVFLHGHGRLAPPNVEIGRAH